MRSWHSAADRGTDEADQVALGGLSGAARPLPHLDILQPLFAPHDLRSIRVYDSPSSRQARRRLLSDAYTVGERVSLDAGAPLWLAAHEAVHAVHQRRPGGVVPEGPGEAHAEGQAHRLSGLAAAGQPVGAQLGRPTAERGSRLAVQRAPNQAGTTDPSHVVTWVRQREARGGDAKAIMSGLSEAHGDNSDRYFYTDTNGWVDIRHFGAAANLAVSVGSVTAEALGLGNEAMQWVSEWGDDYRSGFSPEDVPSNAAGASFGDDYVGSRPGETVTAALERWMSDHRARPASDPRARRSALPATDPSERGGASRGSSNVSRTQSTASGRANASTDSAARSLYDLHYWMTWARLAGGR